jgi:hypothetical protein
LIVAADLAILPIARCVTLGAQAADIRRMLRALIERFPAEGALRGRGT